MKTAAKYCQQLKQCYLDVSRNSGDYHQITKNLVRIYENDLTDLAKSLYGERHTHYANESTRCNLIIEVMDFKKFTADVVMWRRVATIYQNWAEEVKSQQEEHSAPVEFKSKEELQN